MHGLIFFVVHTLIDCGFSHTIQESRFQLILIAQYIVIYLTSQYGVI